ncbi:MAG: hypothetical protein Q4F05_07925 [bacterium]|nr:hypothetical protein [bacterium]
MRKAIGAILIVGVLGMTGCQSNVSDSKIVATATTNSTEQPIHTEAPKETPTAVPEATITPEATAKATKAPEETIAPKETKKPEKAESSYLGSYKITTFKMATISAMSNEEAEKAVGKTVEYGNETFKSINETVKNPNYKETIETKETFEADIQGLITFQELGIEADNITMIEVTNGDAIGRIFYVVNNDKLLICQDGAYFTAVRK